MTIPTKVMRADRLTQHMNVGKERALHDVLRAWRRAGRDVLREQWALFWKIGHFDNQFDAATEHRKEIADARRPLVRLIGWAGGRDISAEDETFWQMLADKKASGGRYKPPVPTASPAFVDPLAGIKTTLGAARVQMLRYQIVGMLDSWLSNRKADFVRIVRKHQGFDERTRHELNTVNAWNAWFRDDPVRMTDGRVVDRATHLLARRVMREIFSRHTKPSVDKIGMVLDRRAATFEKTDKTFDYWVTVATLTRTKKGFETVDVPLTALSHHKTRPGRLTNAVQITDRDGQLGFALITDMTAVMKESRATYQPLTEELGLDFGLRTLFATDRGDLYGRGFMAELRRHDTRIQKAVKKAQRAGIRPKLFRPYVSAVRRMQGFLKTLINMVLNRIARTVRPRVLVLEKLNFQNPGLSRRMNRLLQTCGRAIIRAKLQDLEEWFGITAVEINPAYSSQTCSCCGYVDKRNRRNEEFTCRFCGTHLHADVNGARVTRGRRSDPTWAGVFTKAAALKATVDDFCRRQPLERSTGPGAPGDPRLTNPYFTDWRAAAAKAISAPLQRASANAQAQHVVCAEST